MISRNFDIDLLNGYWEMRLNPAQFEKNPKMEDVLQQCHKAREISIGKNRGLYLHTVISGQSSLSLCPEPTFLSQRDQ